MIKLLVTIFIIVSLTIMGCLVSETFSRIASGMVICLFGVALIVPLFTPDKKERGQ